MLDTAKKIIIGFFGLGFLIFPAFAGAISVSGSTFYAGENITVSDVLSSRKIYLYASEASRPICQVINSYSEPIILQSVCGSLINSNYIIIQSPAGASYMMSHTLISARDNGYSDAEANFLIINRPLLTIPAGGYASVLETGSGTITDLWPILVIFISAPFGFWLITKIKETMPGDEPSEEKKKRWKDDAEINAIQKKVFKEEKERLKNWNEKKESKIRSEDFKK